MNFYNKKIQINKLLLVLLLILVSIFTLLACVQTKKDIFVNYKLSEISTESDANKSESDSLNKFKSDDVVASLSEISKKGVENSDSLNRSKLELIKIKPNTAFMTYFKLDQVPVIKKYKYENLELLYSLEQYFNNRTSKNIKNYFYDTRMNILNRLDKTVFIGNTNAFNFNSKYDLLDIKNVNGMYDKNILEQLSLIDEYDFGNMDTAIILNGFSNNDLFNKDDYISVSDKLCDSIKRKNENINIYICSLLPVASTNSDPSIIEKYNNYNLKSIYINNLLSKHYKDKYIDISFLMELGDFEFDGSISKEYSMKIISYLTNYIDVKNKIIDAPMPTINEIKYLEPEKKCIYMTFDDGPSENGEWLLSILDKYDVKATMFYTGNSEEHRKNIIEFSKDNHKIAAHTFTHNFKLYESEEKYFEDLYRIESLLKTLTGDFTRIVRFPGGSANAASKNYSIDIMKKLVADFKYMGYTYYDWNVSSGDGLKNITSEEILANSKEGVKKNDSSIVLFHETHDYTVAIIEEFIKWAKSEGYTFKTLDYDTLECHQSYSKLN